MRPRHLAQTLVVLALFLWLIPVNLFPVVEVGLEGSWQLALNEAATEGLRFGQDVAFNYGPLGYLIRPLDVGDNVWSAGLFELVVHTVFWSLVLRALVRGASVSSLVVLGLSLGLANMIILQPEQRIVLFVSLLAYSALTEKHRTVRTACALLLGLTNGLLPFVKTNSAASALGAPAGGLLGCLWVRRLPKKGLVVAWLCGFALSMVSLGAWFFADASSMARWTYYSLEVAAGYSEAMSIIGPRDLLVSALLLLAAFAALLLVALRGGSEDVVALSVFALPLLAAFKHGFVRQDRHQIEFFTFYCGVAGLLFLLLRSQPLRRAIPALLLFALTAGLRATMPAGLSSPRVLAVLSAQNARDLGHSILDRGWHHERRRAARLRSEAALATRTLPGKWRRHLVGPDERPTVIPWELTYCWADTLRCAFPRTLQLYTAYTAPLDAWTASLFAEADRPTHVLASFTDIDGRHPLWSTPRTWRALIENYALLESDAEANLFLLERRTTSRAWSAPAVISPAPPNDAEGWIALPHTEGFLVGRFRMPLSLAGLGLRALFRIPSVEIEHRTEDGRVGRHRFLPAVAEEGIVLSPLPETPAEFGAWLEGRLRTRVEAIRLVGPGASLYRLESLRLEDYVPTGR